MDFAFDQADRKLKQGSKQRAQQKQKAAAKRKDWRQLVRVH